MGKFSSIGWMEKYFSMPIFNSRNYNYKNSATLFLSYLDVGGVENLENVWNFKIYRIEDLKIIQIARGNRNVCQINLFRPWEEQDLRNEWRKIFS